MKRIRVSGPVAVNIAAGDNAGRHAFLPGQDYEVPDALADLPYLRQYMTEVEEAGSVEKPRRTRKRAAKATAEDSNDGIEPADG